MNSPVIIHHNLQPSAFMWLWAKYVTHPDLVRHCTACLKSLAFPGADGKKSVYSHRFSKASNPAMGTTPRLLMDENSSAPYAAIYLCGVSAAGYGQKKNYPHNLHAAIVPEPKSHDTYRFENWEIHVENGFFTRIPMQSELPTEMQSLPTAHVTCRIFRWAACVLPQIIDGKIPRSNYQLNP
jgi:hypothetical protein